jgi:hypothetical protein
MPDRFAGLTTTLQTKPFFWLLVPVFFLLKNINIYFSTIPPMQMLWLLLKYVAISLLLFGLCWIAAKRRTYFAALGAGLLLSFYFFYGNFDIWLQKQDWISPFNRYRWSLPVLGFLSILAMVFIFRSARKPRPRQFAPPIVAFLNILLILFCLSEGIPVLGKVFIPPAPILTLETKEAPVFEASVPSQRPDIYLILLDEYQGNEGMQKIFNYDNSQWQRFFGQRSFYSPDTARSNYDYTFLSMASIFNMDYLVGEIEGKDNADQYRKLMAAMDLVQDSKLVKFLEGQGYSMHNYSPFRLNTSGRRVLQNTTIVVEKDIIERQTLLNVWARKFGGLTESRRLWRLFNPFGYDVKYYNDYIQQHMLLESQQDPKEKKFVYAHFLLPHSPFLKDSAGKDVDFKELMQKETTLDSMYLMEHYFSYTKYCNTWMMQTIDTLLKNDPKSIVLVMSDHGLRAPYSQVERLRFNTQFYVRTPGKNYVGWPRTVDGVNIFRILLNNEFDQHLGYLTYRSIKLHADIH